MVGQLALSGIFGRFHIWWRSRKMTEPVQYDAVAAARAWVEMATDPRTQTMRREKLRILVESGRVTQEDVEGIVSRLDGVPRRRRAKLDGMTL